MQAGVAAGAGATALALFDYNRMNFRVDGMSRMFRFINSRNYAMAQVNQYRADIRNLSAMTITRCGVCHTINTINMAICTAFFCAGRLGLHGPAPPGWFMGVYLTCIASAFCLQGISYWLSMHANLRATSASVQLLTRHVRLPIPSVKQIDKARQVGSAFEKQRFRDIFRVPFVAPHASKHPAGKGASDDDDMYMSDIGSSAKVKMSKGMRRSNSSPALGEKENARSMPHLDHKRGVPGWFADEWETDRGHRTTIPGGADGIPGHFKMYGAAQSDWWSHDIYARIMMTVGMMFFVTAGSCYIIGTGHCELRAMWMTYASTTMFATALWALIHLDFSPKFGSAFSGFEYCIPFVPILVNIGMSLEYRAEYSEGAKTATMIIACMAYLFMFLFTLRVIDLASPDYNIAKERPDTPGMGWWPASWRVPSSFANIILLVAPPTKEMLKDHPCLITEMARHGTPQRTRRRRPPKSKSQSSMKGKAVLDDDAAYSSGSEYMDDPADQVMDPAPADDPLHTWGSDYRAMRDQMPKPWDIVRTCLTVICLMWFGGLCVRIIEFARGEESAIMKQPGDPPWGRDPNKTKEHDWVNYKAHRRLSFQFGSEQRAHTYYVLEEVHKAMPVIETAVATKRTMDTENDEQERQAELWWRLKMLESRMTASEGDLVVDPQGVAYDALSLAAVSVSWPTVFEPQAMACSPGQILAFTPYGFGALVSMEGRGRTEATSFALDGILDMGSPLLGASWGRSGLLVTMQDGSVVECAGKAPLQGSWACHAFGNGLKLPVGPTRLASAAVTETTDQNGTPVFYAALIEENGGAAAVFILEGSQWAPIGEVALPGKAQRISLAFSGSELMIMMEDGSTIQQGLPDGMPTQRSLPEEGQRLGMTQRLWRGACHLGGGSIARLALRLSDEMVWHPELFVH